MPTGFARTASVILGALLAIFGIFNIPSAVSSNSWGGLVLHTVLFFGGILLIGWALKE
jgi:uncharacterized membrane protein HdeD (DUF308 family)